MSRALHVKDQARELIERNGTTFAEEAGIHLKATPAPLFQLLVLSILLSARIRAEIAIRAARGLFKEGWTSPAKMGESSWELRTEVLNANGYARYDESTARMIGQSTHHLSKRYHGDLRRLREEAQQSPDRERELLQEFKGIGEVGAAIFLREVQGVWPEVYPYVDDKTRSAAECLGLPKTAKGLSALVDSPEEMARLVAALIRAEHGEYSPTSASAPSRDAR